jgi:hypothetical protein
MQSRHTRERPPAPAADLNTRDLASTFESSKILTHMTNRQRFLLESVISNILVEADTEQPSQQLLDALLVFFQGVGTDCVARANAAAARNPPAGAQELVSILMDPACQVEGAEASAGTTALAGVLANPQAALGKLLLGLGGVAFTTLIYKLIRKSYKDLIKTERQDIALEKIGYYYGIKSSAPGTETAGMKAATSPAEITMQDIEILRGLDPAFEAIRSCKTSNKCIEFEISNYTGSSPLEIIKIDFTWKAWRTDIPGRKTSGTGQQTMTVKSSDWDDMHELGDKPVQIAAGKKLLDSLSLDSIYKTLGGFRDRTTGNPVDVYLSVTPTYIYMQPVTSSGVRGGMQKWAVKYVPGQNRYKTSSLEG